MNDKTVRVRLTGIQATAVMTVLSVFLDEKVLPVIQEWKSRKLTLKDIPQDLIDSFGGILIARARLISAMVHQGILKPECQSLGGVALFEEILGKPLSREPHLKPSQTMIKFYKNQQENGNGDIVVQTDSADADSFMRELPEAILQALETLSGDDEFTLGKVIPNAFEILVKLRGYKTELVHEQKVLTCGYSNPDECKVIVDTTLRTGPLSRAGIAEAILDKNFKST